MLLVPDLQYKEQCTSTWIKRPLRGGASDVRLQNGRAAFPSLFLFAACVDVEEITELILR